MIDSSRRSDLFRRCIVIAPRRCALASPSSRFLASTKNLCRGQEASSREWRQPYSDLQRITIYPGSGRVIMNNPS